MRMPCCFSLLVWMTKRLNFGSIPEPWVPYDPVHFREVLRSLFLVDPLSSDQGGKETVLKSRDSHYVREMGMCPGLHA